MTFTFFRNALSASAVLLLVAGCGTSPPVRYYTLDLPRDERCAAPGATSPSVRLVGLSLPEGIDRPQLVYRTGANTLVVNDAARWGEPLKSALAGVLAGHLSRALGCVPVVQRPSGLEENGLKLGVDVQRLDVWPGRAVVLEAVWTLRDKDKTLTRKSTLEEPLSGDSPEAMVAAQSRAVGRLAKDIAQALKDNSHHDRQGALIAP